VDLYPTLCGIARAKLPDQPQDGRSLMPLFCDEVETFGNRPIYWHFPAYLQSYEVYTEQRDPLFRSRPVSVVRMGDFKLKEYFEDGHVALYNLKDDIRERHNLADVMPDKTQQMYQLLRQWQSEVNAPRPQKQNPEYDASEEQKAIQTALKKLKKSQ
jgi:arylsulfatase A-like enzyme